MSANHKNHLFKEIIAHERHRDTIKTLNRVSMTVDSNLILGLDLYDLQLLQNLVESLNLPCNRACSSRDFVEFN